MGNSKYDDSNYSKSGSGLLLPSSLNIKSEHDSKGINQSETGSGQKAGGFVTRDQFDDKMRLVESEFKFRASEANGQLVARLVGVESRLEAVSKDVLRVENGNSTITKEMRD